MKLKNPPADDDDRDFEEKINYGVLLREQGKVQLAIDYFNNLKKEYSDDFEAIVKITCVIGTCYAKQGKIDQGRELYNNTLKQSLTRGSKKGVVTCNYYLGSLLLQLGHYQQALNHYDQGLKDSRKYGYKKDLINIYADLGVLYRRTGEYTKAQDMYEKSIDMSRKTGRDMSRIQAITLNNIGYLLTQKGEFHEATIYLQEALGIFESMNNVEWIAMTSDSIANLEHLKGNLQESKKLYKEAIKRFQSMENEERLRDTYNNLGKLLIDLEEYSEASEYLQESLAITAEVKIKPALLKTRLYQAYLEFSRENLHDAKTELIDIYGEAERLGFFDITINASIYLAQIFLQQYQLSHQEDQLQESFRFTYKALELARRENLLPWTVAVLPIIASLHIEKLEFNESVKILEEAKNIASKIGFQKQLVQIDGKLAFIKKQQSRGLIASHKDLNAELLMNLATGHAKPGSIAEISFESLYLMIIESQRESQVKVIVHDPLPVEKLDHVEMTFLASFHSMVVGQGNTTNEGVFGPIPVPIRETTDYSSITYAKSINSSYVLFCLLFPSDLGGLFFNTELIRDCFESKTSLIKNVEQITPDLLIDLKKKLVTALTLT